MNRVKRHERYRRNDGKALSVGLIVAVSFAGVAAVVFGVMSVDHSLNSVGSLGTTVKQIPIPAADCPYLQVVHVAAESAGAHWGDIIEGKRPWEPFAVQLAPKLANFESALRLATPHVPPLVATDLRKTLHQVAIGRAVSPSASSYATEFSAAVAGYGSLSHASDLVGNACGFILAPPPLYP